MRVTNHKPLYKSPIAADIPVIQQIQSRADLGVGIQLPQVPIVGVGYTLTGAIYNTQAGAINQMMEDKVADISIVSNPVTVGQVQIVGAVDVNKEVPSGYDKYALGFLKVYSGHNGLWLRVNSYMTFGHFILPEEIDEINEAIDLLNSTIVTSGNGSLFLADDGTYKQVSLSEPSTPFTDDFTTTDWQGSAPNYTITYSPAVHGQGSTKNLLVTVYADNGTINEQIINSPQVNDDGTVIIKSAVQFNGYIIISNLAGSGGSTGTGTVDEIDGGTASSVMIGEIDGGGA